MSASRYGASRWARPPSGSGQPPTFGSAASPDIPRDSSVGIRQRSLGGGQLVHLGWVVRRIGRLQTRGHGLVGTGRAAARRREKRHPPTCSVAALCAVGVGRTIGLDDVGSRGAVALVVRREADRPPTALLRFG